MTVRALPALLLVALAASGCGLKGPLYLPEKTDVTIRPAPAATAPATTAEPAAPPADPADAAAPEQPGQQQPDQPPQQDQQPGQQRG
jgi:predicted small lipoprotein YifL